MFSKNIIYILVLMFFLPLFLIGQKTNLVPNPSFEIFKNRPLGWYYKGSHFTHTMKYWFSPSYTSPDAYGPKVRIPLFWREEGFGSISAAQDESYVGVTVFGCGVGKSHCREYVSVCLKAPLIVGQKYSFSLYIQAKEGGVHIKELGALFSIGKPDLDEDLKELGSRKVYSLNVSPQKLGWQRIDINFTATQAANFLTMGNFKDDAHTVVMDELSVKDKFGYYYIDNISLIKQAPFLPIPFTANDLRLEALVEGKEIVLRNVHFDTDKHVLRPQSEQELYHLVDFMQQNPKMEILILGYTDNRGENTHNQTLSQNRAEEVGRFLNTKGKIDEKRFSCEGKGEENAVYNNDTEEGRQLNRRVSFKIIKL